MKIKFDKLEAGTSYFLTKDESEQGEFVQNLRGVTFFKPKLPTKFLVDTQEHVNLGHAYPETLGLVGIPHYGNESYEEVK